MGAFFVLVILLLWGAAITAFFVLRKGEVLRFESQASAPQVIMAAVSEVGTKRRWSTNTQTSNSVSLTYVRGVNWAIALLLLFFGCIVTGIIYIVIAGKKESLHIQVDDSSGRSVVSIASNGWRGKAAGRSVQAAVGVPTGTNVGAVTQSPTVIGPTTGQVLPPPAPPAPPLAPPVTPPSLPQVDETPPPPPPS